MNLPVPGVPNHAEIDSMKRMMQIMNAASGPPAEQVHQAQYSGGYGGTPPPRQNLHESHVHAPAYSPFAGQEDVVAMKNILERLNSLNESEEPAPRQMLAETSHVPAALSAPAGEWKATYRLNESNGKQTKTFNVGNGSQMFVEGLLLSEAAQALAKLLNRGLGGDHHRVQEVLDLEESYNRHRLDAQKIKGRFNRCVELGEDAAADVFRERHQVARAQALIAHDELKSILESLR